MIRFIVRGKYMNPGGDCERDIRTFDYDLPDLEKYLSENVGYAGCGSREVIGAEIITVREVE